MSMKKLAVACALACGTLAATGAQAYDVDLFLSGASAVQSNFVAQLPALMVAGYTTACDNTSSNCSNFFAVKGTFKSAAPVPAALYGKTVRITYRTRGGSVWGVDPVAKAAPIQWMDMDSTVAGACAAAPAGYTFGVNQLCAPTGNDDGTANSYGPARVSDLGVSDVEPKMFQAPLNVEYDTGAHAYRAPLDPYNLAGLSNAPVFENAFAMPMTNVIPHDMTTSNPALNMFVDKATLQGLLSKNAPQLHDWSGVANAPLAALNPGAGASNGTNKPVVVCRRVQGSGTQATTNYFVNNFGCSGASYVTPSHMADSAGFDATGIYVANTVTSTAANPIIIDPSYGYTVVENPGSGDVRSCLTAAQNGTNWAFKGDDNNYYQVTFSGAATGTTVAYSNGDTTINAPFGAVGVLSYDSAGKESGWHFHDLNGLQTATKAAIDASNRPATSTAKYAAALMVEGPWEFMSEESMQYRNGANGQPALVDAPVGAPAGPSLSKGPVKTLSDALIKIVGDPALINANLGIAALPTNYAPTGNVTTNKVAKGTKSGDTCNPKTNIYQPQFWN